MNTIKSAAQANRTEWHKAQRREKIKMDSLQNRLWFESVAGFKRVWRQRGMGSEEVGKEWC